MSYEYRKGYTRKTGERAVVLVSTSPETRIKAGNDDYAVAKMTLVSDGVSRMFYDIESLNEAFEFSEKITGTQYNLLTTVGRFESMIFLQSSAFDGEECKATLDKLNEYTDKLIEEREHFE